MQREAAVRASYGHRDQVSVLELCGQVRFAQARALRGFVDDVMLKDGSDTVLIDLRGVDAIDSTGMGLLARIGRSTLEHHGRRAVIVGPQKDVATCLRSACFDVLFHLVDERPFDPQVELQEVPLDPAGAAPSLGLVVLQAHQDLAALSAANRAEYQDVIAALEPQLKGKPP